MVTGKQSSIVKQRRVIEDEVKLDVQYGKGKQRSDWVVQKRKDLSEWRAECECEAEWESQRREKDTESERDSR